MKSVVVIPPREAHPLLPDDEDLELELELELDI